MSFIKIKDPRKREELIKDLIETRKRIKDNFVARKVGEIEYQTGLTKLFKPVIETQKATAKEITDAQKTATEKITQGLLPIQEAIKGLTIETGEPIPAIEYTEKDITELGEYAADGLQKTHGRKATQADIIPVDAKEGFYKIGKTPFKIKNNDLYFDFYNFKGTPGLWELLTSQGMPDKTKYEANDLLSYIVIMYFTNATRQGFNKDRGVISGNDKMHKFIKPFVRAMEEGGEEKLKNEIKKHFGKEDEDEDGFNLFDDPKPGTSGTGLILPSDPNALIDRFDLLFSSQKAGHTGVRNEIVAILDELKRQGVIKTNEYKKINSLIKK